MCHYVFLCMSFCSPSSLPSSVCPLQTRWARCLSLVCFVVDDCCTQYVYKRKVWTADYCRVVALLWQVFIKQLRGQEEGQEKYFLLVRINMFHFPPLLKIIFNWHVKLFTLFPRAVNNSYLLESENCLLRTDTI